MLNTTALLVLGAAASHFALVRQHLDEYVPFGAFFLCLALLQVALALALLRRPSTRLFARGAAGSLVIVGIWGISRTVGLPFGPHPFEAEDVGLADSICSTLEIVSAVLLFAMSLGRAQPNSRRPLRTAFSTVPFLLIIGALTYMGVAAGAAEMPVAFNIAPPVADQPSTSVSQLTEPDGTQPFKRFALVAAETAVDGRQAWTHNGKPPGPELRVNQGDRVEVTLVSHLPVSTSIHWHGIDIPNAMDGVAGITQDAVQPGAAYVYTFVTRNHELRQTISVNFS